MPPAPFDAEAYLRESEKLLGFEIAAAYRPGVIVNLQRSAAIAAAMLEFELPDDVEAGPVFEP